MPHYDVERFSSNPIIGQEMGEDLGNNINGPSLIRVPSWVKHRLGKYYLYFAHHRGKYIRMAYADNLKGPWTIYGPGTLSLSESRFIDHIASPDVHVLEDRQEIRMYYHGCLKRFPWRLSPPNLRAQATHLARLVLGRRPKVSIHPSRDLEGWA